MNVLICDPISPRGIEYFRQQPQFKVTVLEKRLSEAELIQAVAEVERLIGERLEAVTDAPGSQPYERKP